MLLDQSSEAGGQYMWCEWRFKETGMFSVSYVLGLLELNSNPCF